MGRLAAAALVGLASLGSGCRPAPPTPARSPPASFPVAWSPKLRLASPSQVPALLRAPFPAPFEVVALQPGGAPKRALMADCNAYFELRPKGYEPLSQPDSAAMKLEGATCQALKAIETGGPATAFPLRPFPLNQGTLARLPAALGPQPNPADADRRRRATAAGASWAATDSGAILAATDDWTARVNAAGWSTDVDILARGDLNGDGADDLLVETLSTGSEGSWSEVRLRLLTSAPSGTGLRIVKDYPL